MSKTASMAMMGLDWVKGKEELKKFDFVFLIRLRYADKESSLAELIISQHNRLEVMEVQPENIKTILKGKAEHKTLLMLVGYDEYKPGTNKDIDDAIEKTVGSTVLILTSRPGYLDKTIRPTMRNIATIKGFSQENIKKNIELLLGSKDKAKVMIEHAREAGIYDLLHVPVILLFSCLVFQEHNALPKTQTQIYKEIFNLLIERSAEKDESLKNLDKDSLENLLDILGEASWKALQKDTGQLLLNKVNVFTIVGDFCKMQKLIFYKITLNPRKVRLNIVKL